MVDVLDDEYALKLFAYSNKANLICTADQGLATANSSSKISIREFAAFTCTLAPIGQLLTGYFASKSCLRY